MKVGVKVMPRTEVLDSQGRAVEKTLKQNGLDLASCRVGRYIILELNETNRENAVQAARKMSDHVLYNPLIETVEIEVI